MKLLGATLALLLLGPPASARTVELRVSAVDEGEALLLEQSLERELGDRLLEDGHRLVPAGAPAQVQVWIHVAHEVTTIDVRGRERRIEPVPSGPLELVGLEIQQLCSALIDEVGVAELAAPSRTDALVIEVSGGDEAMRRAMQSGLLARGHALSRVPGPGDLRVCIDLEAGEAGVTIVEAELPCPAPRRSVSPTALAPELARERLLDRTEALLDARVAPTRPDAPTQDEGLLEVQLPAADELPANTPTPAVRLAPQHSLALALHGGGLARTGAPIDPLFGGSVRVGRRRGIGGGVEASVMPSRATDLRVLEATTQGLFDGRIAFGRRGALEGIVVLGLLAGVHIHHYRQTVGGGDEDTFVSPSFATVARVGLLRGGLLVFGGLRAGWSGGRWVHLAGGEASWRRSSTFVGLELGVGWDWVWRRTKKVQT